MINGVRYSLVIPCYNEAANLPLLLERASESLSQKPGLELILVDNGSSDKSPDVLAQLLPRYPFARSVRVDINQGYGHGILSGLAAAKGEILGWTHADMQTDPADFLTAIEYCQNSKNPGPHFIKGLRYGRPLADQIFTVGMSLFETVLLMTSLRDINAQPTVFPRTFFTSWENPPKDFSLDLFAYYQAKRQSLKVYRFPVLFSARSHGVSHWNIDWRSKVKFIQRTVSYSLSLRAALRK